MMKRRFAAALLAALMMNACAALADTPAQLAEQAKTPWRETITAHGRELTFDVTAQVPDVEQMGLYRVTCVTEEDRRSQPAPEMPSKRRGIAQRRKPSEVFSPEELDPQYRAFGNPLTAGEAVALAQQWFEQRVEQLSGVQIPLRTLKGWSPVYLFDKNAQQWLDVAVEGSVGSYSLEYEPAFMGAPLLKASPFYADADAFMEEGANMDDYYAPWWSASASIAQWDQDRALMLSLPHLEETLAESVELAPLGKVLDTLRGLVQEGYLRDVQSLRLGYHAFLVGERPDPDAPRDENESYLLRPVWEAFGEAYPTPEEEATDHFGEIWKAECTVIIDAQTGEWITRQRAEGWE